MRIAAISDIHGNLGALEAVLADIGKRGVDLVVNLGDILSGPLFPAECAERLIPLGMPAIRGNHERQLLTLDRSRMSATDRFTAECLQPDHWSWISRLPESLWVEEEILLVHGTPHSDVACFLETVDASGARPATPEEIQDRTGRTSAAVVLHGHTHIPRIFKSDRGPLIVNPGSVGLPAYRDDLPFPHKMEAGSPHARYAIVEKRNGSWSAALHDVIYDWEAAAAAAGLRQRWDWAGALRSGRV